MFDAKKNASEYWGKLACSVERNHYSIIIKNLLWAIDAVVVDPPQEKAQVAEPLSLSSKKVFEKNPTFPTPGKENANKTWHLPV